MDTVRSLIVLFTRSKIRNTLCWMTVKSYSTPLCSHIIITIVGENMMTSAYANASEQPMLLLFSLPNDGSM